MKPKLHQCYVEEQTKVRDSFILDSFKILKSLVKKLTHFLLYLQNSTSFSSLGRDLFKSTSSSTNNEFYDEIQNKSSNKSLKVVKHLNSLSEIEQIRKNDRYKTIGRNLLGVKKYDDWINNLEIGNVMHLNPLSTQALL
jgi:hypothetical protein